MVKSQDPGQRDLVKKLFDSTFRLFRLKKYGLTHEQAIKYIHFWFKASAYDSIFAAFSNNQQDPPDVILKNCRTKSSTQFLKHYPAEYDSKDNKITVCMNLISNRVELKENIDRQLLLASESKKAVSKNQEQNVLVEDMERLRTFRRACALQYQNYVLGDQTKDVLAKRCAKYLYFHREPARHSPDFQFRYVGKLISMIDDPTIGR